MLEVKNIIKKYEGKPLLEGVSFSLTKGETLCLLGASGSGKSTILKIIAGLEAADSGQVLWAGKNLKPVTPDKRNFGFMFQDYALFPHRTVGENIAFGLRMQKISNENMKRSVAAYLRKVDLTGFAERRVTDLSGGEQQRVALARALAPEPRLLMLDEPMGALDRALRDQLTKELRRLLHETEIPTIYVTHDQEEAFMIADRLILLHEGQIIQSGTPFEVYSQPKNEWVAGFLGLQNIIGAEKIQGIPNMVRTSIGNFILNDENTRKLTAMQKDSYIQILLASSGLQILDQPSETKYNIFQGVVKDLVFQGDRFLMHLDCGSGYEFQFFVDRMIEINKDIVLRIPEDRIYLMG
ncbi:MAG: ABC transporter ATP-binding protein [Anaerolineaceae bacterium]|nr:ABC transporter ATP-binding protein [Anaerolineaceae bacterium]